MSEINNETLCALKGRRACRRFKPEMIKEDELAAIIEAGTYAPSGMGKQAPIILAITNKEIRDQLAEENRKIGGWKEGFDPFYGAPVVLVVLADKKVPTYLYDGSLVMGNLMNAAQAVGIGSIWIHRAKEIFEGDLGKTILKQAGIEGEFEGIGNCCLGYIDGELSPAAKRKEKYVYYLR